LPLNGLGKIREAKERLQDSSKGAAGKSALRRSAFEDILQPLLGFSDLAEAV